jgi:disulfide bond formation protein DsbB
MISARKEFSEFLENISFFDRQIVYIISLAASLGSLSASMIFGWDIFPLSLAQRILMYPIVVISGLSILIDREDFMKWILLLSTPGILVSLYHYLTVRMNTLVGCGFALPCNTESRILIQGFTLRPMYLPLMAFIAFSLITLIILLDHSYNINSILK